MQKEEKKNLLYLVRTILAMQNNKKNKKLEVIRLMIC